MDLEHCQCQMIRPNSENNVPITAKSENMEEFETIFGLEMIDLYLFN